MTRHAAPVTGHGVNAPASAPDDVEPVVVLEDMLEEDEVETALLLDIAVELIALVEPLPVVVPLGVVLREPEFDVQAPPADEVVPLECAVLVLALGAVPPIPPPEPEQADRRTRAEGQWNVAPQCLIVLIAISWEP